MSMITYERDGNDLRVRVAGTITGRIRPVKNGSKVKGYRYYPIGSTLHGDTFKTVEEVKHSLESDDED